MDNPDGGTAYELHPDDVEQQQLQLENPLSTLTGSFHDSLQRDALPPAMEDKADFFVDDPIRNDVVVICKNYYMSHSLRYPALLHASQPPSLSIGTDVWHDLQQQLGPLLKHQLFLPKSYLFVPLLCLMTAMGWFLCFSIATAAQLRQAQQQYGSNVVVEMGPLQQFFWLVLFFSFMGFVWWVFRRWVQRRNAPADDALRHICAEWSRRKLSAHGYRLDYHKANTTTTTTGVSSNSTTLDRFKTLVTEWYRDDVFATRVLRFVPLPVPRKIMVVQSTPQPSTSLSHSNASMTSQQQQQQEATSLPVPPPKGTTMISNLLLLADEEASVYSTLPNESAADFDPFPASDRILENVVSLLFVLIIFQCVHSLP